MNLSIKEAFRAAWAVFKKDPWPFVGATAILFAVSMLSNISDGKGDDGISIILGIIGTIATWWLYIGFLRMGLSASAGGKANFKDLFSGKWPTLLQFAIAAIITGVIVVIGFVLLIVPGIIAQTGLLFGALFVVDKGMKGWDSVKASWNLTKGHKWQIFWTVLVLALFNVLGAIVVGIGLLVTIPMTFLGIIHLYRELEKGVSPVAAASAPTAPPAPNA